ncbi:DUF6891 domain-containing protein [Pseudonocardia abyssalis]|uniref:DUF6891 domain-containing protein n=1 Tax=Pseudonocardia abyssalis TaxID=2792008 RepID=A0ABS6UXJ1_9PSEU|nr:hypothetical protein [Pseudonocardia abyssalis]MBW0116890.1 hypothetical protein [Pseudonocardia abyssalis]MBW0136950.1 hypothetical protein [Pseudonocardia abyssalis]
MFDGLRRRLRGAPAAPTAPAAPVLTAAEEARLAERVAELVLPGFRTRADVVEIVGDQAGDDFPGLPAAAVTTAVDDLWRARLAEQESWPPRTDADRLDDAFAALEASGIVARMNFTCCLTCGRDEIRDEAPPGPRSDGFVFFHEQDAERLSDPDADLYLAFGAWSGSADAEVGERVRAELVGQRLVAEWDGDAGARLVVRGQDWRRRLPG